ncbi:MAG: hypothetical protein ACE5H3_12710, partial [Planctomycetota bacterium]
GQPARRTLTVFRDRLRRLGVQNSWVGSRGPQQVEVQIFALVPGTRERIERVLRDPGRLSFAFVVWQIDHLGLKEETNRFRAWVQAHPRQPLSDFNRLSEGEGGPRAGIAWFPFGAGLLAMEESGLPIRERVAIDLDALPLRREGFLKPAPRPELSWEFTEVGLEAIEPAEDPDGRPALRLRFRPARAAAFRDFTESFRNRSLAILRNEEIEEVVWVQAPLEDGFLLTGGWQGYTADERDALQLVLQSGALPVRPRLVERTPLPPRVRPPGLREE